MTLMKPREPVTTSKKRLSHIDKMLAESGCYLQSEVAEILGVSQITVRRLLKVPGLSAPSRELVYGGYKAYLYTTDDVKELGQYLKDKAITKRRGHDG